MGEPVQSATILSARSLSPHVRELVLVPLTMPISFKPGQWLSLRLPIGPHPPVVRAYSMAEPQSASGRLVLVFDRVPEGFATQYLFGLKEGDQVTFSGPHGRFVLPDSGPSNIVFIARYTGIVPIRCMLRDLFSTRTLAGHITVSYTAPTQRELIFHDEFTEWVSHHRFHYLPQVSDLDEQLDGPVHDWPVVRNLAPYLTGQKDFIPMISGIKSFVRPLRAHFMELGFERRDIRVETYD